MNFIPWAEYKDLIHLYANSKCCVLCSLFEGKNRSIFEAMACNTPIVVFKQYNQYSRGNFPIFRENSGETVSVFSPECLADTIHKVIKNPTNYEPRENYCKYYGRKNFIKTRHVILL